MGKLRRVSGESFREQFAQIQNLRFIPECDLALQAHFQVGALLDAAWQRKLQSVRAYQRPNLCPCRAKPVFQQ